MSYPYCKVKKFSWFCVSFRPHYYSGNFVAKQNVLCRKLNTIFTWKASSAVPTLTAIMSIISSQNVPFFVFFFNKYEIIFYAYCLKKKHANLVFISVLIAEWGRFELPNRFWRLHAFQTLVYFTQIVWLIISYDFVNWKFASTLRVAILSPKCAQNQCLYGHKALERQ